MSCMFYLPYQVKELSFGDPKRKDLIGQKLVVYADELRELYIESKKVFNIIGFHSNWRKQHIFSPSNRNPNIFVEVFWCGAGIEPATRIFSPLFLPTELVAPSFITSFKGAAKIGFPV